MTEEQQLNREIENGAGTPDSRPARALLENLTEEMASDIAKCLDEWGCCIWCVLRFLGDLRHDHYKSEPAEFLKKLQISGQPDGRVCISCLGLLQMKSTDAINQKCREKLDSQSREFNSFLVVMKLPVALIPREHAVLVLLREKFPAVYGNVSRDQILAIKPIWKMIYADKIGVALGVACLPESLFEIRIQFGGDSDRECNFLKTVSKSLQTRKTNASRRGQQFQHLNFNQNNVTKALSELSDDIFKHYYQCPPRALDSPCECTSIDFFHASIYVAGRYNKYSREFGQTPWFVEGEQKIETSVQEIITPCLLETIKPMDHKFMASGREDVDVRMLGRGRPFMIEFVNPKIINLKQEDINKFQAKINESEFVKVRNLQLVSKQDGVLLKEGEMEKTKNYSALIWCQDVIDPDKLNYVSGLTDLSLDQLTPIRVLHRRSHCVRERMVYSMTCTLIDDHHFQLSLNTQAGTYIKEFVHGDFGRTRPNLGHLLGTDCDILALDVEDVILDWPQPVEQI